MHSMLKVFDLRLTSSQSYHSISLPTEKSAKPGVQDYAANAIVNDTKDAVSAICGSWNLYLNPRVPPKRGAYPEKF
jgi:hypothetical protein